MPHDRNRHIQEPFDELIRFARIVGITGQRQTGKTTFVQKNANDFFTLDDEDVFLRASKSAKKFIAEMTANRSAIDECQLIPALFPALKVFIGTSNKPGRFILTGSVRFTSREAIKESLTGRISTLELYPFVLSEIQNEKNSDFFVRLLNAGNLRSFGNSLYTINTLHTERMKAVHRYFESGGMPGLFHLRKIQTRNNFLRDMIETILDRDIRLVYPTNLPYQQIYGLCKQIAEQPGRPVNYSDLKRQTGIGVVTQKKILRALESVFLLRRIPMDGDFKGELYWFEDQIQRTHFAPNDSQSEWDWIGLIYRNARAQFGYRLGQSVRFSSYRTRGGAQVPLVLESQGNRIGIFHVENAEQVTKQIIRSAESFLTRYGAASVIFLNSTVLQSGREIQFIGERMLVAPMSVAFFE